MKRLPKNKRYWACAFFMFFAVSFSVQAGTPFDGKTVQTAGKVEVDGQSAFKGMAVSPNATIKTYKDSFIEIVFNEKIFLRSLKIQKLSLALTPRKKVLI